jgi:transcriptional regulator with XRE-family HTH domain
MLISDLQDRLREIILAKVSSLGFTQRELAESANLRQPHLSNFLTGKRGLRIETMDGILRVLNLEADDLMPSRRIAASGNDVSDFVAVPLVALDSTMFPTFADGQIFGIEQFNKALLQRLRHDPPKNRKSWLRFVAVRIGADVSAALCPRLGQGSVCLIDRHYCSLTPYRKTQPNLYMVRKEDEYLIRYVEIHGTNLCLRPFRPDQPLEVIPVTPKQPLDSCVVGRVAHLAGET